MKNISDLLAFVRGLFRAVESGEDPNDYIVRYAREHFPDQPLIQINFTLTDGEGGSIVIDDEFLEKYKTPEGCIEHLRPGKTVKTFIVKRE